MNFTAKGKLGKLTVTPTKVILEHNRLSGHRGAKEIYIKNITSIQLKTPGLTAGYIEFSFAGGTETRTGGALAATKNENAMIFSAKHKNDFIKAKELIEQYQMELESHSLPASSISTNPTTAEQIRELAKLRDDGIITPAEFEASKQKLLGL
ncbi:SHOCT domain-containing protein [Kroppenstedtia eburnea]|uniref:SHOCT domain-containing protein n=1 Tax=Kroppenstedtia eburnea TaxID=714067 RepID=UPI003634420D